MKKRFSLLLLISIVTFFSCNEKKEDKKVASKQVNEFFSVDVDVLASKSDDFTLYYSEDNSSTFKDINAIWKGINGGKFEIIEYVLSDDILPTHIRLDFGLKQNQDSVVVKNIKVNYYGNSFELKGSDFFDFFIKDEQFLTKTDQKNGTMTILAKEGVYKTPYYYPTQTTINKIKEITVK